MTWLDPLLRRQFVDLALVAGVANSSWGEFVTVGAVAVDPAGLGDIRAVSFEAVLEVTDAADTAELRLFDLVAEEALVTLSASSLSPAHVASSVALAPGKRIYEAQLRLASDGDGNIATCKSARLRIDFSVR
ncbi:MAG: hypothetical protein KF718_33330 [Polyangiaceae bacterium]|nr:hypothetical protein [Polyangiaceae bacterium]